MTPGPPSEQALPTELKIPPPIIAAIPKKVRSRNPKTLDICDSEAVGKSVLRRKSALNISVKVRYYPLYSLETNNLISLLI